MARCSRIRRLAVSGLVALAGCEDPVVDGGGDESTGATDTADTGMSTSSSGAPTTSSEASTGSDESSSESGSDESSSSGSPAVCGDGTQHPDELCDDGNNTDEDGCNADCVPSGSLSWSWEPPEGQLIQRVDYGPDDHLWVVTCGEDGCAVREFDRDGVEVEEIAVTNVESPPGERGPGVIEDIDVEATDDAVYVAQYRYWMGDSGFTIAGQVEAVGMGGWVTEVPFGVQRLAALPSGGVVALDPDDDVLHAFDSDGNEAWTYPMLAATNDVRAVPDGVVAVALDRVVALDDAGAERWTFPEPAPEVRFMSLTVGADAVWVYGDEFPPPDTGRLWRLDFTGQLLDERDDSAIEGWFEVTPTANLVWSARRGVGSFAIEKVTASLDLLWAHEWTSDEGWRHLDVDGSGAVAAAKSYELRVLSP